MQGGDATDMRFQLAQFVGADDPNAGHTVGECPLLDVVQPCALDLVEGDEHLSARDPADAAFLAELFEQADAPAAEQRLVRTRLVIEPRVHDAAVASGLVRSEPVLLLEQRDVCIGLTAQNFAGHGNAEDAATDDSDSVGHRPSRAAA